MTENTFAEYNEEMQRQAKFKHDIAYFHIVNNPGIHTTGIAKLMYATTQNIDQYIKHIEKDLKIIKAKVNTRIERTFYAKNPDTYEWGSVFKRQKDPLRTYFERKFKDLPEHLKEPIFTGKIDASIVRSFNEGDLDHTYTPHKPKKAEYGIPSLMGEL